MESVVSDDDQKLEVSTASAVTSAVDTTHIQQDRSQSAGPSDAASLQAASPQLPSHQAGPSPAKRPRLVVKEEVDLSAPVHHVDPPAAASPLPTDTPDNQKPEILSVIEPSSLQIKQDEHQRELAVSRAIAELERIFSTDEQKLRTLRASSTTLTDRCRYHEATITQLKWEAEERAAREGRLEETVQGLEDMVRQLEERGREKNGTIAGLQAERGALLVLLGEKELAVGESLEPTAGPEGYTLPVGSPARRPVLGPAPEAS